MKFFAFCSSPPADPQRAAKFQRAPPEVLGLAVITSTFLLSRSFQLWIFLGLPGRTNRTTVELVMIDWLGSSRSQPRSTKPLSWSLYTSAARAKPTTSASRPSITARVWLPEPP